jgi:hypothetical protein
VTATNATELADGAVPPVTATGNFILGPTHTPAAEVSVQTGVPQGAVHTFTMNSADSKIYPGIARAEGTRPMVDPTDPARRIVTSGPAAYTRRVAVYVPQQYIPGTIAPFIVGADGPDQMLFTMLDNVIAQKRVPAMIAISIGNGSGDAQGSQRGPRVRHDVRPLRGVRGIRSAAVGGDAIQRAVDERSECTRRDGLQLGRRGSAGDGLVSQRSLSARADLLRYLRQSAVAISPGDTGRRVGIPQEPDSRESGKADPYLASLSDRDNFNDSDGMHDWVLANQRMAQVLASKGYSYQFVFARNAGHCDRGVKQQTLPQALEWIWKD